MLISLVSLYSGGWVDTISSPSDVILKLQLRTHALLMLYLAILKHARLLHIASVVFLLVTLIWLLEVVSLLFHCSAGR